MVPGSGHRDRAEASSGLWWTDGTCSASATAARAPDRIDVGVNPARLAGTALPARLTVLERPRAGYAKLSCGPSKRGSAAGHPRVSPGPHVESPRCGGGDTADLRMRTSPTWCAHFDAANRGSVAHPLIPGPAGLPERRRGSMGVTSSRRPSLRHAEPLPGHGPAVTSTEVAAPPRTLYKHR